MASNYLRALSLAILLSFFYSPSKSQCNFLELTGEFPQTINGVLVSVSYSGATAGPLSTAGQTTPCVPGYSTSEAPWLGNSSEPTSITFTFSAPVNNVVVAIIFSGVNGLPAIFDNMIFSTNAGIPSLASLPGLCPGGIISGPNYSANIDNNAEFLQVIGPGNYTSLTISQPENKQSNGGSGVLICSTSLTPTPVSLLKFTASRRSKAALLQWQTSSEINSSFFDIERSLNNGETWQSIGTVPAKGNSDHLSSYDFIDNKPSVNATIYYRLRCVDLDGKFKHSEIRKLKFSAEGIPLLVYPNPAHDEIFIEGETLGAKLQLLTMSGQVCETKTGCGSDRIDLAMLTDGIYILRVMRKDGSVQQFKIVKK